MDIEAFVAILWDGTIVLDVRYSTGFGALQDFYIFAIAQELDSLSAKRDVCARSLPFFTLFLRFLAYFSWFIYLIGFYCH